MGWALSESKCWTSEGTERFNESTQVHSIPPRMTYPCKHGGHIILDELKLREANPVLPVDPAVAAAAVAPVANGMRQPIEHPVFEITRDGIYIFQLTITQPAQKAFQANIHIEIRATYGYLSAIDYPLLMVSEIVFLFSY